MASLAEIRKKLQALESKKSGNFQSDGLTYAFWNIPDGASSTVRFLPDGDQDNTFFWKEKQIIKLPFPGVKGEDEHKEVTVQVPCMEMWEGHNSCPVLAEIRPWWQDKTLEDTARKYWVKRSYIFQGLVIKDGMEEDDSPENPIRKFTINKTIFEIIKSALLDPDFEDIPTDYVNGTDFIITKGKKGGWADYSTSKWARKESSLSEAHIAAIDKNELADLSTYLPRKPSAEELNIIFEMFEASVAGELYDPKKWAKYYRPYGLEYKADDADAKSESEAKPEPKEEPKAEAKPEPKEDPAPASPSGEKSAEDILAMIRNRK